MSDIFALGAAKPLACDIPLLKRLGLAEWNQDYQGSRDLGTVRRGDSYASVKVCLQPTSFWKFEIRDAKNDKKYFAATGSGSLSSYWPLVEALMEGRIVAESHQRPVSVIGSRPCEAIINPTAEIRIFDQINGGIFVGAYDPEGSNRYYLSADGASEEELVKFAQLFAGCMFVIEGFKEPRPEG